MSTKTRSRLSVVEEAYDEFSVFYLGELIIGTATFVPEGDYWEVVVISEKDEQDCEWFCVPERPTVNDITVSHNNHFVNKDKKDNG